MENEFDTTEDYPSIPVLSPKPRGLNDGARTSLKHSLSTTEGDISPQHQGPNSHRHGKRRKTRTDSIQTQGHLPTLRTLGEVIQLAEPIYTQFSVNSLKVPRGAYTAMPARGISLSDAEKEYTEEELINDHGFMYIDWDGFEAIPLVDLNDRVYAVLAGRPNDPKYINSADKAYDALVEEGYDAGLTANTEKHKRGAFPAFNVGYTYGVGNQRPGLRDNKSFNDMLDQLVQHPAIQRLTTYGSASFQLWAPRVYEYYNTHLKWLYTKLGSSPLFPSSVFPSIAFNLGGKVRTFKHRDVMNIPFGWCSITALGEFDPDRSAKLVLWEAKVIIRFPHASTINIPSATMTHSNTAVQEGDFHVSITQFAAGGLFCWVDNGGRTEDELKAQDPEMYQRNQELKSTRWKDGIGLLSTWAEMRERFAEAERKSS